MINGSTTEDLQSRWNYVIKKYQADLEDLKIKLGEVGKTYNELRIIQKELLKRGVELEEGWEEQDDQKKIS